MIDDVLFNRFQPRHNLPRFENIQTDRIHIAVYNTTYPAVYFSLLYCVI